jgi:hypothetical protein
LCFTAARENDNREIGCLNEEEIPMPSLTGLLFKWPLIRQIRERARAAQALNGDGVTEM